jgi:hypothetical protein
MNNHAKLFIYTHIYISYNIKIKMFEDIVASRETKKNHRLTLLQQQGALQELLQLPAQLQSRRNAIRS